ncbi:hypothetical protein P7C71_g4789, partial [Lecanoromycetidae sp. Uapishka_2]
MKFTKSNKEPKEPKKTPQEAYAEQISTLTETELRDLHKDLKIDHYGNTTAAAINTASGVGLLSMRSTTRRYRTECWQIEAMEARMKEQGWTPHPNRYRDAVPIALGVAAGTTHGMSFGLINVEKNAKRTKDYVKKKDLFKTKEVVESQEVDVDGEEIDVDEEVAEFLMETTCTLEAKDALETTTERVAVEHSIARKPVPVRAASNSDADVSPSEGLGLVAESTIISKDTSVVSAVPITKKSTIPVTDEEVTATELKKSKKEALFSQVSVMNKKMRTFTFKKDKEEKETTISVTEIPCDAESPVMDADAVLGHGAVEKLDSPPTYTSVQKECIA